MPVFVWEARARSGETRNGEMEAQSEDLVRQRLRAQSLQVTKLTKKPMQISIKLPGGSAVTTKDLVVFTRQFATMIDAGLPLVQCLDILGTQNENPVFKKILLDVKTSVESGTSLAEALGKHPKVFDRLFVGLVAAGEAAGVLDTILNRLASYIEKNMKLIKQVRSAMVYPAIVVVVAFVVSIAMLIWVIPVFQKMFQDFGQALPGPTQLVVDLSEFVRSNILFILIGVAGLVVAYVMAKRSPKVIRTFDRLILRAPAVGQLVQKVAVAKFTRTLGTMLSSGVPILEALEIVASTAGNTVVEEGLRAVKSKIAEGKTIAQPLSEIPVFPPMVVQMISVGESSGALDTMLNKIADFYDDEVDAAVGTMMSMLEPMIMAFLAVLLGGLVISMYLPVFSMAGAVG
jgi:type IV pilus assembly protein PilC